MKKKCEPQSSIGRWLNEEAHRKDEPKSDTKKVKKEPKTTKKPSKKK